MAEVSQQWIRNRSDELAVAEGCWFDERLAEHAAGFFPAFLRHSKGRWAGRPFELLDWQRDDLLYPLFGWRRPDGSRRFRRALVEVPKKNGKSTIAAGISLYCLEGDNEPGAEVYNVAIDRNQASIVFEECYSMVMASQALTSALRCNATKKRIFNRATRSWLQVLPGDAHRNQGWNIHALVFDELHAQKNRMLWDAIRYGGASRENPLLFAITTAGDNLFSIGYEQHEYAQGVLSGAIEDSSFFGLIYAADPADDWTDPAVWSKANPSLGATIDVAQMAADCREAKQSPASESAFKRYRLNLWQSSETPAISPDDWFACQLAYTADDLAGRDCYGGLDLSKTEDTSALVLAFPPAKGEDDVVKLLAWFWTTEKAVARASGVVPYDVWAREGLLRIMPGRELDYDVIIADIRAICGRYRVRSIAYDKTYADHVSHELGASGLRCEPFKQNVMEFANPTAEFDRRIRYRGLAHNGHKVLTNHCLNMKYKADVNQNLRPVKPARGDYRKIDGAVSAIMAVGRATDQASRSVYDDRGFLFV